MFEGVVATILNRYLGKYIQDLDTENLNVGIFSGDVSLTDLRLKPEALYELDLPIEVKIGTVGKITLNIPWSGIYTQSVVVNVEDVYVLVGPVTDREYDAAKEKRLIRAAKRKKIEKIENESFLGTGPVDKKTFFENLVTSIINNLQVFIRNVHFRYEDKVTNCDCMFACGVCIQNISLENTNSKWKPSITPQGAMSVYQLIRMESFSVYMNSTCNEESFVSRLAEKGPYAWKNEMKKGLETFSINNEDFDFIVKPITAKVKVIVNKSNEARVPKLLIDFVLQDAATQVSRQQYLAIINLIESFQRMKINRQFRQYHPGVRVRGNSSKWWKYAYTSVLDQRVRPYSWQYIKKHREYYKNYKDIYKKTLLSPNDTELKLDLQQLEDQLSIIDIVIAREHSKIELKHEEPDRVLVSESEVDHWNFHNTTRRVELRIQEERDRGLFAQLSLQERQKLYEIIGYLEGKERPVKPKQYIEHKFNFTLANCSLSLMNHKHEILVVTLTQFLTSIETRPSAEAFKISMRAESFVMEGTNVDNDLIPMITADNIISGNTAKDLLAVDFEKNPLNVEANFGVGVTLEPVEVVYNEHAVSEIINFFQTRSLSLKDMAELSRKHMVKVKEVGKGLLEYAIARHQTVNLNMDIKGPYFVIPELGSIQKGGSVVVVDFGHIQVKTDIQPSNAAMEDATQMELEERLYDRFHLNLSEMQLIFCDSGDEWQEVRKLQDSDHHLIPKIHCQAIFSNSIKPDYRQMPRYKLNVTVSSLKLNLSDRKIGMVLDFLDNLPLPHANTVCISDTDSSTANDEASLSKVFVNDVIEPEPDHNVLLSIRTSIVMAAILKEHKGTRDEDKPPLIRALTEVDNTFSSFDQSDEENEVWARIVDLPGFDDNVSPKNVICVLLRFVVGEVVVQLARSSNRVDKPYLMLRISKICWDTALMEYGPAVQATLGGIQLIDKIHTGSVGEYLELISTEGDVDVITLLYRKVRADCPDFKSHFHNVEQSLVIDFNSISIVFHREAFTTFNKYLQYLFQKTISREVSLKPQIPTSPTLLMWLFSGDKDPPIPPGATKFSYSVRLGEVKLRLCDTDMDLLEIKVGNLESDCMFKANERMVLKVYLTTLSIEDISEMTLYSKILTIEEDKVFDLKYVRHSPKLYTDTGIDSNRDDVKSDGSLKLHIGRIQVVVLYKILLDLQHFLEPFLHPSVVAHAVNSAERNMEQHISSLRGWKTKLHLSLELHAPTLLLPQKSSSPNLIIINMGDLSVENFFKEIVSVRAPHASSASEVPVIDNVLVRMESIQVSRAVMTLAGSLEIQEPILEPVSLRLDIKRTVAYHHTVTSLLSSQLHRDILLYQVVGGIENIKINLGQRDLATIIAVWMDNITESRFMVSHTSSPVDPPSPITQSEDTTVKKLQAFLCHTEQLRRESSVRFSFDGLQLTLYSDMDEILSSPVRDLNHALCRLDIGEATMSLDAFTDHSLELKMVLQCCLLEDIRRESNVVIKKIFQSHGGEMRVDSNSISVSTPPIIDVTFRQTQAGDRCIDILVEKTRLNLSMPFLIHLGRFLLDALPGDRSMDGGVINHGYVGDVGLQGKTETSKPQLRPPSSADSTSGYVSSASSVDDQTGLSISLQLRKPEIMVFADLTENGGHALLLRTEFLVDYSRHTGRNNLVCSFAGLQILSKHQGQHKHSTHQVLYPCDVEFTKSLKNTEEGLTVSMSVGQIKLHLSASTVHTVFSVIEDFTSIMQVEESECNMKFFSYGMENEDIWSPKKIQPFVASENCGNFPYSQLNYPEGLPKETLTVTVPKFQVVLELEDGNRRIPVLLFKASAEANAHDWSKQMYGKGELRMQSSYYNDKVGAWEPFLEPCMEDENVFRPWELLIKVFQAKAYPLSSCLDHENFTETDGTHVKFHKKSLQQKAEESETSADDAEPENGMTFIRRANVQPTHASSANLNECVNTLEYPDDSDAENEDSVLEKLASAVGHLFTGDSSDADASDSEESSGAEPSLETEEASEITMSHNSTVVGREERAVFLKKHRDSVDSGLEAEAVEHLATYVMINAHDRLELSLTPAALQVLHDLVTAFTTPPQTISTPIIQLDASLSLSNDIWPNSKISLYSRNELPSDGKDTLIMCARYKTDSGASSPASTTACFMDAISPESDIDFDSFEGGFNYINSANNNGEEVMSPVLKFPCDPVTKLYNKVTNEKLLIEVEGFDPLKVLVPQRMGSKLHVLQPNKNNTRYYVAVSNIVSYGNRRIAVHSPLQIKNETSYAMGLYYKKSVFDALGIEQFGESINPFDDTIRAMIIEPDETVNIPLFVAYHCKIYILPAYVDSYRVSEIGLWWQEMASDLNMAKDVYCLPKEEKDPTVFSIRVMCGEGMLVNRASRSIPNYTIRLLPPLAIHNRLPYAVEIKIPSIKYEVRIEAGEKTNIYFLNLLKLHKICIEVPVYLGIPWSGSFNLTPDLEEKIIVMATEYDTDGGNKQLGLSLRVERTEMCDIFLYAPYWIVNKTGLPLQIRASLSDVVYEAQSEEPLLFCYKKRRRRCVRLRAYHSSWSSAFSLDTVGCTGLVICHDRERKRRYRLLLRVTLSQHCPQLSKIVTLLPNFLVTNSSRKHLRFMEENEKADLWIDLAPSQSIPFWPDTDSMRMYVKFQDSNLVSQHFPITQIHQTVLRMDKGSGLCVDVSGGCDQPFSIVFRNYIVGDAPVRVDNLCEDLFLKIHQHDLGQVALLSPYQTMLYTWDDPSKERCLLWNVYNNKSKGFVAQFWKDGYGQERVSFHSVKQPVMVNSTPSITNKWSSLKRLSPKTGVKDDGGSSSSDDSESDEQQQQMKKTRKDKVIVYWVSYLEGQQRVLLFTQDERVASQARNYIDVEKSNLELFLSISGIGISLCTQNNIHSRELAYFSVNDSSALWEVNVAHKWKSLTLELSSWIEDKWKQDVKKAQMKDYVHVDFEKMHMTKPFYGELKRRYEPGLWVQYRKSENHSYVHCKLHRIQIDNQLPDAVFPIVLYPVQIPQHVVRRVGLKPCIEVAFMKRQRPACNLDVYKFLKVLVQEFSLQLDKGFMLSIYNLLSNFHREEKPSVRMRADITLIRTPLTVNLAKNTIYGPKAVIEYLHLSPLKLQFSFSPRGTVIYKTPTPFFQSEVVEFLFNMFGATLTEVKGIKLKMAYFEQRGCLVSLKQEWDEIYHHYVSQLIQQIHVLILGLDVLGNPYGLITDFTEGFGDFFYEPFLGGMEGPEEFADGLSYGAKSLMGHIVGGTAGSVSLISSSLGDLISNLSFDEDYKKKRKFLLQQSSDLPSTLLSSAKTFVMGVTLGLSGVIIKPVVGAQQEGIEGFFKGIGKGLMGLMTKPSGGVLDCIAMALDGIKRAMEMGEDVIMRTRLPRYINPYTGLRPYSVYQATGMQLLNTLSKGHYCDTDIYWAHASLNQDAKTNVLVTLQHVFLLEKCRLWGNWDVEWRVRIDDIMAVPCIAENKLIFKVRQDDSLFQFSGDERHVESEDSAVLEWLQSKIEAVMILNMEDKPCPSGL